MDVNLTQNQNSCEANRTLDCLHNKTINKSNCITNINKSSSQEFLESEINTEIDHILSVANCFEQKGYYLEAIKCYKQLENRGAPFLSLSHMGRVYYQNNQLQEAEQCYLDALLHCEESSELHFSIFKNLGNIYLKNGEPEKAEVFYYKAFALNEKSSDLMVNLATLDLIRQKEEQALEKYRKAIYLNDTNDKAWSGLALIYESYGDLDLTIACLKRAMELNPKNTNALHLYSQFCFRNDRLKEAIEVLENWIVLNEFCVDVHLYLIELLINDNQTPKAKIYLDMALLWEPQNTYLNKWHDIINA